MTNTKGAPSPDPRSWEIMYLLASVHASVRPSASMSIRALKFGVKGGRYQSEGFVCVYNQEA